MGIENFTKNMSLECFQLLTYQNAKAKDNTLIGEIENNIPENKYFEFLSLLRTKTKKKMHAKYSILFLVKLFAFPI